MESKISILELQKNVSIPNRDFDELLQEAYHYLLHIPNVSIPNRDFDELLSGLSITDALPRVSIPNRDFDELRYLLKIHTMREVRVSIPNRDFDELQWEPEIQAVFSFQGTVARFKSNHSIREFVWGECQETLKTKTLF